jgi:hypothetical protein
LLVSDTQEILWLDLKTITLWDDQTTVCKMHVLKFLILHCYYMVAYETTTTIKAYIDMNNLNFSKRLKYYQICVIIILIKFYINLKPRKQKKIRFNAT